MERPQNILIITYYWPPAGGPGVQRWLKFTKYLPELGWNPIVYSPENPSYPLIDESLTKEIPNNITHITSKIWEPYHWAEKLNKKNKKFKGGQFDIGKKQNWKSKISIWIRGNFFIPDARIFWVKPSVKKLKKYIEENNIQTIVTTGPPHSMHLIGLGLKKANPNLFWLADFRDPWTEISYYKHLKLSYFANKKHHQLEQKVFTNADITLATSYTDAKNFSLKGANAHCITNGFDGTDILPQKKDNQYFTISYTGVLEQLRNPEIFWNALEEICIEDEEFESTLSIRLIGRIDEAILESINKKKYQKKLHIISYLPHHLAVEEMNNAHLLLLTNFPEESSRGIIPGKIFEYLAVQTPIISFGPEGADVSVILDKTKAGRHFSYQNLKECKAYIIEQYINWKDNKKPITNANLLAFTRKELTKNLVNLLPQ